MFNKMTPPHPKLHPRLLGEGYWEGIPLPKPHSLVAYATFLLPWAPQFCKSGCTRAGTVVLQGRLHDVKVTVQLCYAVSR